MTPGATGSGPRTEAEGLLKAIDELGATAVEWAPAHSAPYVPRDLVRAIVSARLPRIEAEAARSADDRLVDLPAWLDGVVADWRKHWRDKDHRYGRDFAAFVGERLLTDFELRDAERAAKRTRGAAEYTHLAEAPDGR